MLAENEVEHRKIFNITPRLVEPVYNFTTNTHTYLVANGVVVHNCDTVSMLSLLNVWKPSEEISLVYNEHDDIWAPDTSSDSVGGYDSYVV